MPASCTWDEFTPNSPAVVMDAHRVPRLVQLHGATASAKPLREMFVYRVIDDLPNRGDANLSRPDRRYTSTAACGPAQCLET